jgi:hypothetical protein
MPADQIALADVEIGGDARVLRIVYGDEVHGFLAEEVVSEVMSDKVRGSSPGATQPRGHL